MTLQSSLSAIYLLNRAGATGLNVIRNNIEREKGGGGGRQSEMRRDDTRRLALVRASHAPSRE